MKLAAVEKLLGGKKTLHHTIENQMDLIALGEKGITKNALRHLTEYLDISLHQMAELLPITERTIQRYAPKETFNRPVSEHILHIANVTARGAEVFGDREKFVEWTNIPNRALADKRPIDLLASMFGANMVLDELGRIEHGVVS